LAIRTPISGRPRPRKGFLEHDRLVIDSGQVNISEESIPGENGASKPILTRKARLTGPDGKTYLIGTNTDLAAIKQREDQYKALSETVPVGVMQIEEDGRIAFCNPLLHAYCGGDGADEAKLEMIEKIKVGASGFSG
jgi:hypothetical protein